MDLTFSLERNEIAAYLVKNAYAQMMVGSSEQDYISSRCLIYNKLTTGFSLYAQAVEKFLKAFIFLETGKKQWKKSDWHHPYNLKSLLRKDYGLDRFDELLKRLHGHFQSRYHDNTDQSKRMSSDELDEFDELWTHLFDLVPFPIEIKYRLQFAVEILDKRAVEYWPSFRYWATVNNKFLPPEKINRMEEIYLAVQQHLHGDRIQKA